MKIKHYHFDSLASTNIWAKQHLKTFDRDLITIVTANTQTDGRGQYGRKWISTDKNLCASFCFFINEHQQDPLSITHVLAISTIHVLKEKGIECQIKWPNDILASEKKIAGILCETEYFGPRIGVVIGIGLNINMSREELEMIDQPAASMKVETGKEYDRKSILEAIQTNFSQDLALFLQKGFEPFLPAFRKHVLPGLRNQHIL